MPRDITLTFSDGTAHVYKDAPDTITPEQAQARAKADFPDRSIANVDGGQDPATRGKSAPIAVPAVPAQRSTDQLLQDISPEPPPPPKPGLLSRAGTAIADEFHRENDERAAAAVQPDYSDVGHGLANAGRAVGDFLTRAPTDVPSGTPAAAPSTIRYTPRGPQVIPPPAAPAPDKLEAAFAGADPNAPGAAPFVTPLEAQFGETIAPGHEAAAIAAVQQRRSKGIPAPAVPRGTEVRQPNSVDDFLAGRAPPAPMQWVDSRDIRSETDKLVDAAGGDKSVWGRGVRNVADMTIALKRVEPQLGKIATEGLELASAGYITSPTELMEHWDQSLSSMASGQYHAQQMQLESLLHDPNASTAQVTGFLVNNPGFATLLAIPSAGSMLVGAGGAKLGEKLALAAAERAGLRGAALARAGERGAEWGSNISNAAMNGADNFHDTQGNTWDKFLSAAIAAGGTLGVGHLTEGGAAARVVTGGKRYSANPVANAAANLAASVGKEGVQEYGEQVSQDVGQAVGEGKALDLNAMGKNAALAATQGAILGVAGGRGNANSRSIAHDAILASVDDVATKHGLFPKAAAALRDAVVGMDQDQAIAFVGRALHGFEASGDVKRAGSPTAFRTALAERLAATEPTDAESAPAAGAAMPARLPSDNPPASAVESPPGAAPVSSGGRDQGAGGAVDASALLGAPTEDDTDQANAIAAAAHGTAATSPLTPIPEPTDAQKAAGNYAMGHVKLHGLDITIENPQGSVRSGTSPDGSRWTNTLPAHYGYIRGTKASDGDHVDTFIGPSPSSQAAYVIDQVDPKTGKFDEPKTILGATSEQQARELYLAAHEDGWNGMGAITALPIPAFKAWVADGVKDKPLGDLSQWKSASASATAPAAAGATFKTAKGSSYQVHEDGTTTRDKAARADIGHEGDAGPQQRSQRTFYVDDKGLQKLGEFQAISPGNSGRSIEVHPNGMAGVRYSSGPSAGKFERRTMTDFATKPAVGLTPVELWNDGKTVHFGNKITDVSGQQTAPSSTATGTSAAATTEGDRNGQEEGQGLQVAPPGGRGLSETGAPPSTTRGGAAARGQSNAQHPERIMSSRVLGLISKHLGGLDPAHIADFSARIETKAIGKDGKRIVKWRNPPVSGVGRLFRAGGTSDFEEIGHLLQDHGYIAPGSADVGQKAYETVQRILQGDNEPQTWEEEQAAHEASREAEHQHYLELHAESARELDSEREAIMAAADMKPADLDSLDDDMLWDAKGVAHATNPFEGDDRAESGSTEADAAATRRAEEAAPPAPAAAKPPAEDRAPAPQPAPLTAQTPTDLEAKAAREAAGKKADADEQKRLADKAKADAERSEFTLTGSDRPADVAAAGGQRGMFDEAPSAQSKVKEPGHVPSTASGVERDRGDAAAGAPAVEGNVSPVTDGTAWVDGRPGEAPGGDGSGRPGDAGLHEGGTAVGRESGDQPVHREDQAGEPAEFPARDRDGRRSDDPGVEGAAPEAVAAARVADAAEDVPQDVKKRAAQRAAESIEPKLGDIDNIRATLPYLLPEQQDDVLKAETRFAVDDGYGMLFTNGTGTGKTFTGMGIVKRFARRGKRNVLVVVPDAKIMADWIESGKPLGLTITALKDTKDAGKGVTITTYANLGDNDALASRAWDLVVPDEAHMLMQEKDGSDTKALDNLRAITLHPRGVHQRFEMRNRADIKAAGAIGMQITANDKIRNADDTMDVVRDSLAAENAKLEAKLAPINARLDMARAENKKHVADNQGAPRPRVTFLSATPFAYVPTVDWAEGYLFDYPEETGRGYNQPNGQQQFMIEHFGYRMRTGKLNKSDAKVNTDVMERQFNGWLKQRGALSGRVLDVNADYDRKFILVDSAIGNQIDNALKFLGEKAREGGVKAGGDEKAPPNGWAHLSAEARDGFYGPLGHLVRRYLLEAIKAKEVIRHVRDHLALGRKVIVFHDFKKGGSNNAFAFTPLRVPTLAEAKRAEDGQRTDAEAQTIIDNIEARNAAALEFARQFPELGSGGALEGLLSPIQRFVKEFPGVLLINGDQKPKDLLSRYKRFNDDAAGPLVMLVQSDKNKGWSGHDTTGKHQRVMFNLGLPTQPTKTIQQEGRAYRTGQVSNVPFRYLNTGTTWERWAFASTIAERASTAENLGMGESARALKDAYINAFEDSGDFPAGHEDEGKGGKEIDRQANNVLTEWDRAKAFYFGNAKKTSRTKSQEGADYFATPEPLGLAMTRWADPRTGEDMLEPSAGHGAIARWFPESTQRTAIEPSSVLASRMALVFNGDSAKIVTSSFENLHVANKYDAIVMNPPFGTAGRTAIDHLALAASHLREGGRIVALIPTGPAADKKFDRWFYEEDSRPAKPVGQLLGKDVYAGDHVTTNATWAPEGVVTDIRAGSVFLTVLGATRSTGVAAQAVKTIQPTGSRTENYRPAEGLHLVGEVKLPPATFERAGTSVSTRVVIIDKGQTAPDSKQPRDLSGLQSTEELFARLEDLDPVRPRLKTGGALPAREAPGSGRTAAQLAPRIVAPAPAPTPAPAATARAQATAGSADVVEYTTAKGKVLKGVVRTDLTPAQAKEIDPYTMRHGGGWFIREKHLAELQAAHPQPGGAMPLTSQAPFYSPLERAVEGATMKSAPAGGWQQFLRGLVSKGVKPDEIAWSGIDDWLKLQDGKVSRDAMLAYLREGGVRVSESMHAPAASRVEQLNQALKGTGFEAFDAEDDEAPDSEAVVFATESGEEMRYDDLPENVQKLVDALPQFKLPKFEQYTLPGGKNYRELLLTLPFKKRPIGPPRTDLFRSGHWDEPNVLAHIRFNERTDADGKRVLFVEEIQSDWAQQGKKQGFAGDVPRGFKIEQEGDVWRVRDADRKILATDATREGALKLAGIIRSMPPTAPFVGKTDAWVGLTIKRMVKYAVDNGFERIAFVNGEQSAARYDLSKQIDSIEVSKRTNGDGAPAGKAITLNLPNFGGALSFSVDQTGNVDVVRNVMGLDIKPGTPLEDIIGKELTERVMAEQGLGVRKLSGDGLKVGGEGMKAFYDRIVPTVAKDVVRKLGGDGPTKIQITAEREVSTNEDDGAGGVVKRKTKTGESLSQLGFDITDAMRQEAGDGLPLFRDGEAQPARRGLDTAALRDDIARLTAGWDNAPEVRVVATAADLPPPIFRQLVSMKALHTTQALIMPKTGDVYVIAHANRTTEEARFAVMHEILGHYGIRGVLGDEDAYYQAMYQLRQANPSLRAEADEWMRRFGDGAVEGRVKSGMTLDEALRDVRALATEEALADRAAQNTPIKAWQKIVAKVQAYLRSIGWDSMADLLERMSQSETAQLLTRARWHVTGSAEPHVFTVKSDRPLALTSQGPIVTSRKVWQREPGTGVLRPSSAPLDTLLRIPGEQVAKYITRPAANFAVRTIDGTLDRIPGHVWSTVKAGFVSDYGLSSDYKDARITMETAIRKGTREAATLVDQLHGLSADEARVAYLWMQEKPDSAAEQRLMRDLPADSVAILTDLKTRIDELGKEAVALGLISQEVYERNEMSYLHRSYQKYALGTNKGERANAAASKSRAVRILGDQYKGRGLRDDVVDSKIADPDWWQRRRSAGQADTSLKGAKFYRLELRKTPDAATEDFIGAVERKLGRLQKVLYWPEGTTIPPHLADWRNDGLWEARFFDKGGKVGMWRDFTLDERTAMGEIQEVRYAAANTILSANRDIEVARMLKWVAENISELHEGALPAGSTLVPAEEGHGFGLVRPYRPDHWVQVPDASIPGTGLKRWGALAGRYIPGPVWNDLRQVSSLAGGSEWGRLYSKMMGMWKVSKTALSPATHMNNVMSNFVMADAHDIQARHVIRAVHAWLGVRKGRAVKDPTALALIHAYQDNGGDGGKFTEGELREEVASKLIAQLEADVGKTDPTTMLVQASQMVDLLKHGEVRQALAMAGQTKPLGLAKKAVDVMVKAYGHEDEVFRLAAFIKAKEDGLSDHDAGAFARKSFIDYRINAPWIQALRRTSWPFISFTYRVVPMMASVAINKPHKLAKWMLVAGGLNKLAYIMIAAGAGGGGLPPDELERRERAFLPEEKAGKMFGIFPKLLRMPWNQTMHDRDGNAVGESPVFLDLRRFIPGGDSTDTTGDQTAVPILSNLMPGGPLALMGEVVFNRDGFTGKNISEKTDYLSEKYSKLGGFLWRGVMPNFPGLPGSYSTDKLMNAGTGKVDALGREYNMADAILQTIGIKVAAYPGDMMMLQAQQDMRSRIDEIDRNAKTQDRLLKRGGITQDEYDASVKIAKEKIKTLVTEFSKKVAQSKGEPAPDPEPITP